VTTVDGARPLSREEMDRLAGRRTSDEHAPSSLLVLTLAGLAPSAAAEQSLSALAPSRHWPTASWTFRGIVVDAAGECSSPTAPAAS